MGKGIKAKKPKSNIKGKTYKQGRADGINDAVIILTALLMQDFDFDVEQVKKLMERIGEIAKGAFEPNLEFYISTIRKINKDNGIKFY